MLFDSTYMGCLKQSNRLPEWQLPGTEGKKSEEVLFNKFNGYRVSVLQNDEVLEMDCTTM